MALVLLPPAFVGIHNSADDEEEAHMSLSPTICRLLCAQQARTMYLIHEASQDSCLRDVTMLLSLCSFIAISPRESYSCFGLADACDLCSVPYRNDHGNGLQMHSHPALTVAAIVAEPSGGPVRSCISEQFDSGMAIVAGSMNSSSMAINKRQRKLCKAQHIV